MEKDFATDLFNAMIQTVQYVHLSEVIGIASGRTCPGFIGDFHADFAEFVDVGYGDAAMTLISPTQVNNTVREMWWESTKQLRDGEDISVQYILGLEIVISFMEKLLSEAQNVLIDLEN